MYSKYTHVYFSIIGYHWKIPVRINALVSVKHYERQTFTNRVLKSFVWAEMYVHRCSANEALILLLCTDTNNLIHKSSRLPPADANASQQLGQCCCYQETLVNVIVTSVESVRRKAAEFKVTQSSGWPNSSVVVGKNPGTSPEGRKTAGDSGALDRPASIFTVDSASQFISFLQLWSSSQQSRLKKVRLTQRSTTEEIHVVKLPQNNVIIYYI